VQEKKSARKEKRKEKKREKHKYETKDEKEKEKDNELFDKDSPELDVKEIKSYKISQEDFAVHGYLLEKDKSFLIQGFYYFLIYDSNTFEVLQEQKFKNNRITYISIIDEKRFLIAFEHNYEYYELKNNKYECTKNIKIKKDKKGGELKAITLLKDQTKLACGEGTIISIRELETGKLTLTLKKHKGSLQVLFIHKSAIHKYYLVSCCLYLNLCFWNLDNYELIKELEVDIKSPTSYLILKNTLDDLMITIGYSFLNKVDLDILTIEGKVSDSGRFSLITGLVQLNSIYVLIAAHDIITGTHNFYLLDIEDMELQLMKENVHNNFCDAFIKIGEKRFVSICRDLTFKVWEIKNKTLDQIDYFHSLIKSLK